MVSIVPLLIVPLSFIRPSGKFNFESRSKVMSSSANIPSRHIENDFFPQRLVVPSSVEKRVQKRAFGLNRKVQKFLKAGVKDTIRIVHSTVGLASILVGLHHMIEVVIIKSFSDVFTARTIIWSGILHTLVGTFGIRRLHFKNKKESARNAMFWPAPIQNAWLTSVSLTEWGQGSGAFVSMWKAPFAAFTTFNLILTVWQLLEVLKKTGPSKTSDTIWLEDSKKNAILVEFAYLFWMQIQMGTALYVSRFVPLPIFSTFMDTYPEMRYLLSNLALNTAFFNNLAIFIATLLRYKVMSKPSHDNAIVFSIPLLSSILIVWKVLSCFFLTDGGAMSASFFSLIF